MGNWAQLYADLSAQLQAGQHLGFWDNAFVGFYQSFVAADDGRIDLADGVEHTEDHILVPGALLVVRRAHHGHDHAQRNAPRRGFVKRRKIRACLFGFFVNQRACFVGYKVFFKIFFRRFWRDIVGSAFVIYPFA